MEKKEQEVKKSEGRRPEEKHQDSLVRIRGSDISGRIAVLVGLTKIRGVSWVISNATCKVLGINPKKKIGELDKEEILKIEGFIDNPEIPSFLKNRQNDFDTGEDLHLIGTDLKLKQEFDIKRLKKIKAYKGVRHANNLPVRGQRTKANFRRNRKKSGAVGVKKK